MPTDSGSKKRKTDADGKLQDEAMSGAASDVNTSKKVRNGTHPDHGKHREHSIRVSFTS